MLTFWLVVSLQIAGGDWQIMENIKEPDIESCLSAVAERVQRLESASLVDEDHKALTDEYEVAVTCSVHRSKSDPA
jgi:IS30 family transposase